MDRRQELINIVCKEGNGNEVTLSQLIDEIIFIETQLQELKKLPFISVNPKNPAKQKATPASRLYVQLNAQYNSAIRTLSSLSGDDSTGEESPLRQWVRKNADNRE